MKPITYPARPVNGGALPLAPAKRGEWVYEPKVNGWRALVHCPTGAMFNRQGERLSIAREFERALSKLKGSLIEWLDVEAFERRHRLGRGSLIVLDAPLVPGTFEQRQQCVYDSLVAIGIAQSWMFLHEAPPENCILSFAYAFTYYHNPVPPALKQRAFRLPLDKTFADEDLDGIYSGWAHLQEMNRLLQTEPRSPVFEGMVAKRKDSTYPVQLRTPEYEFPFWVKHRWDF